MNNIIELYVCNINGYYSRSCLFLCICVSCCFVTLSWPCICLGRTEKNWYALLCNNDREHSHNFICNNNGHFQWMSHSHNATGFSKRFMNGVFFVVGWCGGVAIGVCVALPFFFFISFSCVVFICCVCLPSFFACVAIAHCVMWCVCACAMNARFWRCRQLRARVPVALQTNGGQRCFHHPIIIIITIGHNRRMYHVHAFDEVDFFAATSS